MRFHDAIGYSLGTVEVRPGVMKEQILERSLYGEVKQASQSMTQSGSVLTNSTFVTTISVVADAFATENWQAIRYVKWGGQRWSVSSVRADQRPRLILMLGEVWNGPTPSAQ